ncbi:MAG: YgiT-type zinc finger protein [Nitrospirota bacterium]|nr:YgiT-type zinc finger protein [Nitrospirota bacterium]MDE3225040.1 YgiT-type zinc finger protein [Nitrospirota bacterium]MDE3242405.1 YgiT-type zinc finger protein [Nitrospirota bacterium]
MKASRVKYDYGDCHVCGERLQEKRIDQEFWIKGKLLVIEKVPAGVCPQCGERVVKAEIGGYLASLLGKSNGLRKVRHMTVPVLRFAKQIA